MEKKENKAVNVDEIIRKSMRSNYEIIKEAVDMVDKFSEWVKMTITVLDHDAPYNLFFDVTLRTGAGSSKYYVEEFLDYIKNLRDVCILEQKVDEHTRELYKKEGWNKI
ncbi:MAG: hypothetical protein K6F87_02555 [Lachnospiraceae bacterium]|nr:hypothetical protein [Lachnospiraceae bacterium]